MKIWSHSRCRHSHLFITIIGFSWRSAYRVGFHENPYFRLFRDVANSSSNRPSAYATTISRGNLLPKYTLFHITYLRFRRGFVRREGTHIFYRFERPERNLLILLRIYYSSVTKNFIFSHVIHVFGETFGVHCLFRRQTFYFHYGETVIVKQ